jgi:multiple antibiotic resistance protein
VERPRDASDHAGAHSSATGSPVIELFVSALVTFFVVIDPPGCAPIYAGLTSGASATQRRSMAIRAVTVATIILLIFALFGEVLLRALGIGLDAFRIAGGLMLFLIAIDMVFERRTQRREDRAQKIAETPEVEDVSIFPMAMPMIAGPGSIATVMLLMSQNSGLQRSAVVLAAMLAILALTLLALIAAGPMMRLLGARIEAVITRLLGVLLAALAAQFVIDGLKASFAL